MKGSCMERLILVLYGLSSPKALRQIPKILARFNSRRIQKSVYKALVNEKEEIKLQDLIVKYIDMEIDKVLMIPLSETEEKRAIHIGCQPVAIERSKEFLCI